MKVSYNLPILIILMAWSCPMQNFTRIKLTTFSFHTTFFRRRRQTTSLFQAVATMHGNTFVILTRSHPYVKINCDTHFRKNALDIGQIAMYVTAEGLYFTGNRLINLLTRLTRSPPFRLFIPLSPISIPFIHSQQYTRIIFPREC